jgi:hypothetical protein
MQTKKYIIALSILTSILISGCDDRSTPPSDTNPPSEEQPPINDIIIDKTSQVVNLQNGTNNIHIQDAPKDLYIVFTNTNTDTSDSDRISISHNAKKIALTKKASKNINKNIIRKTPDFVTNFNNHIKLNKNTQTTTTKILKITKTQKNIGDTHRFKIENDDGSLSYTDTTLRGQAVDISTKYGTKTLYLWVSDDSYGSGCNKSRCITQAMVDELQDTFLQAGEDNDIYDWVTNVYGEEWSYKAHDKYSNLIPETNEINILLTDIGDDDKPDGGVMGYFYAQDNFDTATYPNSNEMIMFYVDSVMFANTDNNDFWQKEMYSTLAHEFQHMIHFYQKQVLLDSSDDTWINEMLSETTEDLIATKIEHIGPRGVDPYDGSAGDSGNTNGRYPQFNESNDISLIEWYNTLDNYSNVNAFGAFLTRNYGGAKVLHDILHNNKEHIDAIEYATDKSFGTILQEWGIAVMLSDIENPEDLPTYNTGDFIDIAYKDSIYSLGSINFFNYNPTPKLYTSNSFTIEPASNLYYLIGTNISRDINLSISLDSNTKAVLIAK